MTHTYEYLPWRGITKGTMEKFSVVTKINSDGEPIAIQFPYGKDAAKVRGYESKEFHSVGDIREASLFGKEVFPAGSSRAITITEGELDALSVYQMLGSSYPVVSIRSASSGEKDCSKEREYLNSFEKIYLCFDNDTPGIEAKKKVARLFDFNKIYDVKLSELKDANEYLKAGREEEFKRIWWNSKRFLPETIISTFAEFEKILETKQEEASGTFPFPTLQSYTYGFRPGEVVLLTALEGIGKTEILRAIEHHLLKTTENNIGIIHLEEDKARNLRGLSGYELQSPCHLPTSSITSEEIKAALHKVCKREDRLHLYNHFGSDDPEVILDTIRFLGSSCDCKFITLDHISMVVSGLKEDDERKALDYISTRLKIMAQELGFVLFLVSHVNDEGKTRGSRNISKVADTWIHLERNHQATTDEERNTTYLELRKNRFGARTGPAGSLIFNPNTFIISEKEPSSFLLPPLGL